MQTKTFVINNVEAAPGSLLLWCTKDLSQEKRRRLELLAEKEKEEEEEEEKEEAAPAAREEKQEERGGGEQLDLLQDLRHIEEQMRILLKEKEQADEK